MNEGARTQSTRAWLGFLVGPILVFVALWIHFGPDWLDIPVDDPDESSLAPRKRLSTKPLRQSLGDPPRLHVGGFDRTCMDCHRTFPPREDPPEQLMQHKHIVLRHGRHKRCRDCHWDVDRDKLILPDGTVLGLEHVDELCGNCHGPVYRDWRNGAHGRSNGYWDTSRGERVRLECTECHNPHNPHVPAMEPIEPLPGPNTLRAGRQRDESAATEAEHSLGPLERKLLLEPSPGSDPIPPEHPNP
jgi:hypothetical protein